MSEQNVSKVPDKWPGSTPGRAAGSTREPHGAVGGLRSPIPASSPHSGLDVALHRLRGVGPGEAVTLTKADCVALLGLASEMDDEANEYALLFKRFKNLEEQLEAERQTYRVQHERKREWRETAQRIAAERDALQEQYEALQAAARKFLATGNEIDLADLTTPGEYLYDLIPHRWPDDYEDHDPIPASEPKP